MGPLPNGIFMAYKWGAHPKYLLNGMILQEQGGKDLFFVPLFFWGIEALQGSKKHQTSEKTLGFLKTVLEKTTR